jgi:hypothetical protein
MCRLIPLIFFPRVVTTHATGSRRLGGLAVDAAGAGLGFLTRLLPHLPPQSVMNPFQQAVAAPLMEVVPHRSFRREIMR